MAKYFSFRPGLDITGRKFKGLRGWAGKPLHPPLTDVTIGAYTIGGILDIVAFLFADSSWARNLFTAGGIVILVGAISSVATVTTGFFDWLNSSPGTQVRRMINAHAWTMIVLSVIVVVDLLLRYTGDAYGDGSPDALIALLGLVILVFATIGGTLGGSLTYDWGFNVEVAKDHPVWHPSPTNDYVHPHDDPQQRS